MKVGFIKGFRFRSFAKPASSVPALPDAHAPAQPPLPGARKKASNHRPTHPPESQSSAPRFRPDFPLEDLRRNHHVTSSPWLKPGA